MLKRGIPHILRATTVSVCRISAIARKLCIPLRITLSVLLIVALVSILPVFSQSDSDLELGCGKFYPTPSLKAERTASARAVSETRDSLAAKFGAAWNKYNRYLLLISTNFESEDKEFDVDLKTDAIKQEFVRLGYKGYATDKGPVVLSGREAKRQDILDTLSSYILQPNDTLLVYVVAHGNNNSGDFNFFAADSSMSMTDIVKLTRVQKSGKIFLILDSCFSGQATQTELQKKDYFNLNTITAVTEDAEAAFVKKSERDAVISDPIRQRSSPEVTAQPKTPTYKGTALSYYLTQALADENWPILDDDHDGVVTFKDLHLYLKHRIKCAAVNNELTLSQMEPVIDGSDREDAFAFRPERIRTLKTRFWMDYYFGFVERYNHAIAAGTGVDKASLASLPVWYKSVVSIAVFAHRDFVLAKATKYLAARDYAKAVPALKSLESNPDNLTQKYFSLLGLAQRNLGQFAAAKATYEEAVAKYPDNSEFLRDKAFVEVFTKGDVTTKDSVDNFLTYVKLEVKDRPTLSAETRWSIDVFRDRLTVKKRLSDLKLFDSALKQVVETSQNP